MPPAEVWIGNIPKPINAPERVDDPVVAKTAATQLPLPLDGQKADVLTDIHHADASPLDAFLDETGFSEAKEYEWLQDNDATTPFKPVSSAHLANTKLTKKLDAQLQRIARKAMNRLGAKSFRTGVAVGE